MNIYVKQFRSFFFLTFVALVLFGLFSFSLLDVHATQQPVDTLGLNRFEQSTALSGTDIRVTIARGINTFLSVIGVIAVLIVLYGGFVYMTAGGSEEKVAQAKRILINGAIGLAIIFSSWAITKFVLSKLQQGTGTALPSTTTSTTRIGQQFNCSINPTWCCARDNFIVQSITPRTNDAGLNNAIPRVVFSRGVRTPANQVLDILRDGTRVDNEFSFSFTDGSRRVIEAIYTASSTCQNSAICLPPGNYRVRVQNAQDNNGNALSTNTSCGSFPSEATFTITPQTQNRRDRTQPAATQGISINGTNQANQPLPIGRSHPVSMSMTDNRGIGYVQLAIGPIGAPPDLVVYDGPAISRGSDAPQGSPYTLQYPMALTQSLQTLRQYQLAATITDLDSNTRTVTTTFVAVGSHCFNNVQDGDETGVDVGGSCLGIGSCTANWQCLSGQCTAGQCLATPIITRVDPWDGAEGSWVTIVGRFFGEADGQVAFGYDRDRNGVVTGTEWVNAPLAQCNGLDMFHDDWIIAAVPPDASIPQGATSSIRVTRANDPTQFDTTTDARGPIGGPNNGLYTKNNITRPGICRVESIATGATTALPRTPVRVLGQGFGANGTVAFGGLAVPTASWSAALINTTVPESLQPGTVGVNVSVGGQVSNGFPFQIAPPGSNLNPVIQTISPVVASNNSFVTLSGTGFGNRTGRVFLTTNQNATCTPLDITNGVCFEARTTLNAACGDTWRPQQVVVQVQGVATSTQYFVRLRNAAGFQTTGATDIITGSATGAPIPGICRITPENGPAPRAQIQITGSNFSQPASVHFWSATAAQNPTNIATWPVFTTGTQVNIQNSVSLQTPIPITAGAETMQSGPIYVQTRGGLSNGIQYTVSDCRQVPQNQQPNGFHCCEDGSYRPNNLACPGQTRDAGYVWRFTTGKTPNFPYVIQECRVGRIPSPSPARDWDQGRPACINADIRVRFNLDMDPVALQNGIKVYTCGIGADPQCNNRTDVTQSFTIFPQARGARIALTAPGAQLAANTWYHVELENTIQSQHAELILGQSQILNEPLKRTRPCNNQTAYCFDFKTDDQRCRLADAFVEPPQYTTRLLGMLQDGRYPLNFGDPFNAPNPFYYYLWGQADRRCMVIDVDGLGWQWDTNDRTAATAAAAPSPGSRPAYTDSRATAIALRHTGQPGVEIQATTSTLTATSSLVIDLGNPKVVEHWPNCVESCTNANIGVQFNQYMATSTYANGLIIQQCADPLCTTFVGGNVQYNVVTPDNPIILRVAPAQPLLENTWYRVSVNSSTVRGRTSLGSAQLGNAAQPFVWRFRTKVRDGFCIAGRIAVEPDPFTARKIGQKTRYQAIPFSSPNQCSTYGQGLNPWAYGWQWQTLDSAGAAANNVASVSQFQTVAAAKPYCTASCQPRGSNIARGATVPPLCGDGIVDRQEDCDIAGTYTHSDGSTRQEQAGLTCSLDCRRPGSAAATCGDGVVNREFGEECDPAANSTGCSAQCTFTGSVPISQFDSTSALSSCGDGTVDANSGEECDLAEDADGNGVPDEVVGVTCTDRCLNVGNRATSRNWCTANATTVIDGSGTTAQQTAACRRAQSVCGNNVVEQGEACEVVTTNADGSGVIRLFGQAGTFPVQNVSVCSNSCVLTNICNETLPVRCDPATEGCDPARCVLRGSSLRYSTPSLCGDTVIGIGETPMCEYATGEYDPTLALGQDPVQVVTAVGNGTVNPTTNLQEAQIEARAVQVQTSATQRQTINVSGRGAYGLQCGYTEYRTRRTVGAAQQYNDCPNNANNASGVGYNSCCYTRPSRVRSYPADGAGLPGSGSSGVCLNTHIEVSYNQHIDESTLQNNFILARGYANNVNCSALGQQDVTNMVVGTIAYVGDGVTIERPGLFKRMWHGIKGFFASLFGRDAVASTARPAIQTWCQDPISLTPDIKYEYRNNQVATSTVRLAIDALLTENTVYAVVARGGVDGVQDIRGVGIRPQLAASTDDSWIFQTDTTRRVCKVSRVTIDPASHMFTVPNSSTAFTANVFDKDGQQIRPIPNVYEWRMAWGPNPHSTFAIPSSGPTSTETIQIGSRNVEGKATGFGNLVITRDDIGTNRQATGTTFTGLTNLRSLFCENPWPPRQYYPYEDGFPRGAGPNNDGYNTSTAQFDGSVNPPTMVNGQSTYFNFSTGYCADNGRSGTTTDDLPYLEPIVFVGSQTSGGGGAPPSRPPSPGLQQLVPLTSMQDGAPGVANNYFNAPTDIVVQGGFAYFLSSGRSVLGRLDVRDPANPRPLTEIGFPGTGGPGMRGAHSLAMSGNTAHILALGQGQGSYKIIDFIPSTLPGTGGLSPRVRGELSHSSSGQPHLWGAKDIVVQGNYAYITVSGFELRSNGLQIIDISNPQRPVPAGYINHGNQGAELYGARGLFIRGNYAYVTVTGFGIEGMQIIDISNPQNLRPAGFIQSSTQVPLIGAEDVFVSGNNAYVAVSGRGNGGVAALSIIDVSNPNRPTGVSSIQHTNTVQLEGANHVVVVNNVAYVTAESFRAVTAIDVSTPASPTHIHSLPQSSTAPAMYFGQLSGMWVDRGYIYTVSQRSNSLEIIDARSVVAASPSSGPSTSSGRLPQEVLKRYLFTSPRNNDAIGIQIFANPNRQTAREWFSARHGASTAFRDVRLEGFDGISDGSNLYVNFLNQGPVANDVQNYIFLLSINKDAQPETRRVYDQMVDALEFLTNVTDAGYCSVGGRANAQNIFQPDAAASVACTTDFQCLNIAGSDRVCANAKTKLLRDWRRIADVRQIQQALTSRSSFPGLPSGTYFPTYTNSRWPSWNQTLASRLGVPSLPQDPVNDWTSCGSNDPQTCWNVASSTFLCPRVTSIYEYKINTTTQQYTLHAPFEYFASTAGVLSDPQLIPDVNSLSFTRWCTASSSYSPFASRCGDGLINVAAGEQCDPPGRTRLTGQGSCRAGEQTQETCSESCTWKRQCVAQSTCGNGIVEPGEVCDDGQLNGQYGQCAGPQSEPTVTRCQGRHPFYCGDGTRNFIDSSPRDGFKDAGTRGVEFCEVTDAQFTNQGFCQKRSCLDARHIFTQIPVPGTRTNFNGAHALAANDVWAAGGSEIHHYDGTSMQMVDRQPLHSYWDVHFVDAQTGWAVGQRGSVGVVRRTADGGASWITSQIQSPANFAPRAVYFTSRQRGVAVGLNGIVAETSDGGTRWTGRSIASGAFNDVYFVDDLNGWIVGSSGIIYHTTNGGGTWTQQGQGVTTRNLEGVHFVNSSVGFAVGSNDVVLKTVNGGRNWTVVTVPTRPLVSGLVDVSFADLNNGMAIGWNSGILATNDGGNTWTIQNYTGPSAGLRNVDMTSPNQAFIAGYGNMFISAQIDPYCQNVTRCTSDIRSNSGYTCSYNDSCIALGDSSYHFEQGRSCAASCREVGGYCGDGAVNPQYEECEPTDQDCSAYCLTKVQSQQPTPTATATGCGNGTIDAGEQCDNGAQNGVQCDPRYGQSCTYCSSQCRTLTRDPIAFCGDGVLQRSQGEVCDIGRTATSAIAWDPAQSQVVTLACAGGSDSADRRGQYTCVNNCRQIDTTCTVCGFIEQCSCSGTGTGLCGDGIDNDGDGAVDCADTTGGGANPQYAILNPMLGNSAYVPYDTQGWASQTFIDILRPRLNNITAYNTRTQGWLGVRGAGRPAYPDPRRQKTAFADNRSGGALRPNNNINTNPLCRDAYYLDVNSRFIADNQARAADPADLHEFPVDGQTGVVQNEYVMSPAVPFNVFRVVVRWGADEFNANAHFIGRLYNDTFGTQNGRIVDLTRAVTANNVCERASLQNVSLRNDPNTGIPITDPFGPRHWWPTGCNPFEGFVYVHPEIASSTLFANTYVQSMTIRASDPNVISSTMAFFVDEISGPIRAYENGGMTVEVYTSHRGQNSELSTYKPQVFRIRDAAGTSSNPLAEYWHVFNLVWDQRRAQFNIVPVQSIERDIRDVLANM